MADHRRRRAIDRRRVPAHGVPGSAAPHADRRSVLRYLRGLGAIGRRQRVRSDAAGQSAAAGRDQCARRHRDHVARRGADPGRLRAASPTGVPARVGTEHAVSGRAHPAQPGPHVLHGGRDAGARDARLHVHGLPDVRRGQGLRAALGRRREARRGPPRRHPGEHRDRPVWRCNALAGDRNVQRHRRSAGDQASRTLSICWSRSPADRSMPRSQLRCSTSRSSRRSASPRT